MPRVRSRGPGLLATLVVAALAFVLLVANGRPLASPPAVGASAWLLSLATGLAGLVFEIDAMGSALVGKAAAALFAALAAGALFSAVARRHGPSEGRWAGLVLALGTTLAAAAQGWSGEAAATAAIALAVMLLVRAVDEDSGPVASFAGLPLGLAVALQPSTAALALVLVAAVLVRWRISGLLVLAWAAPGLLAAFFAGSASAPLSQAPAPDPATSALALLASPARGILLFTPVLVAALAGAVVALRAPRSRMWDQAQPGRFLPVACLAAFVAHVAWLAFAGGFDAGPFWGPRLVAPAWPPLLLFLPEGFAALRTLAAALALVSIGVQALGLLSYDGRWDKLYGPQAKQQAGLWDFTKSPILFHARERVARVAVPGLEGRRLTSRPQTLFAPRSSAGSFVTFDRLPPAPTGADATFDGLRFEGEARFEAGKLVLEKEGDGVGFRVREGARPRRLEIRVLGRGQARIGVAESGGASGTRWRDEAVSGSFRLKLPYFFADSGGPDIRIVLRSGGPVSVDSVSLVPPSESDRVLRLP